MADNPPLGEVFRRQADEQFALLQSLVADWREGEKAAHEAMLLAIDRATVEVMDVMAQQEPVTSTLKRRKWFLKPDYVQYLKDKGVPVSNSAEYPFNAPFKLIMYDGMNWSSSVTDPDYIQQRKNAESEVSHMANVAALSLVRDKKPSELVTQYGSVRKASDEFVIVDKDEKARERAEAARKAKEKRDADAEQRKADRQKADAERAESERREREEQAAEIAAKKEQAEIERQSKLAEKAALDAERKANEARAASAKAERLREEQEARRRRAEEAEARMNAEAAEREKKAEETRLANEKREADLAEQRKREDEETARLEEERKQAEKDAKAEQRKYKLSVAKDRNDLLTPDLRSTGAWLRVEWRDGDWYVINVRPAGQLLMVPPLVNGEDEAKQDDKPAEAAASS